MNSLVLKELATLPVYTEFEDPVPVDGWSVITLKAASLNRRDYWISKGLYPGVTTPVVMGSDGVGLYKGKMVIIDPGLNWGNNEHVQSSDYSILGVPKNGTFAEKVLVSDRQIHIKPEFLSIEEAAALPLSGVTAYRALKKANVTSTDNVLVTGIGGGVAIMALQFALSKGCTCFVSSSSNEKISRAIEMGAKGGVNYKEEDWVDQLNKLSGGIDIVIDGAGGDGISDVISICNSGGRISIYGGTAGPIGSINPQKLFWKQLSIFGTSMGSQQDFSEMLEFVNKYKIVPIIDRVVSLSEGALEIDRMGLSEQFGKTVLTI